MDRFLVGLLSLLLFSQFSFARDPISDQEVADIISEFQYDSEYTEISSKKSGGIFSRCWVYKKVIEATYPGNDAPLTVKLTLHIPNRDRLEEDEQVPAVIMVPPIGGVNYLDRKTAETICDHHMAAIILEDDFAHVQKQAKSELLPPEDHQETFYRIGSAVKGVMTLVDDDKNIDISRLGLFGVSLGGILGSFVMATQPDIAAGFFVVAGGDIPNILAHSDQEEVSKIRKKRMKAENISSKEEYEAYLRQYVLFDPLDLSKTMVPETLQMIISKRDQHVPTSNQMLLLDAFGKPKTSYYNDGHVGTIISFLFPGSGRRRVARFFRERFKLKNPRPESFYFLDDLVPLPAQ